ncbi:ribosomal RNA small subunit methyltransferase nep-1-like [Durio zibethinus]|uniref:Ribosomal RNA small subunit methyltransferase nep-1-like n=1 Tax=Durio zibethinus TaxID=66656 RepID=A0A6P6ALT9_DURZI|nr:ribosomal RNA small subunit methyltransferase nep-1-like [Durio zibethinus]
MVKRLLPCLLRFSRRPLYRFSLLQRVSGRVEKKRRKREILQPYSRSKSGLEISDKSISKGENRDKTLDLMVPEGTQLTRNKIISEAAAFELPASLVCANVGKRFEILRSNKHAAFLRKKNRNPYNYRPDIVYEALGEIMDSRLCKAGRLEAIYVKNDEGVLIKIEPNTRMPRGLGGFCSMMAQLLQKFSIKAAGGKRKLLLLVENPVTQYLPVNSRNPMYKCCNSSL